MVRALEDLDSRGVQSVRLDATPRGRPMYEFARLRRGGDLRSLSGCPAADRRDSRVTRDPTRRDARRHDGARPGSHGTDRGRLLRRLADEHRGSLRVVEAGGGVAGFLLARPARQPCKLARASRDEQPGPCSWPTPGKGTLGKPSCSTSRRQCPPPRRWSSPGASGRSGIWSGWDADPESWRIWAGSGQAPVRKKGSPSVGGDTWQLANRAATSRRSVDVDHLDDLLSTPTQSVVETFARSMAT